jgi:heme a synthase
MSAPIPDARAPSAWPGRTALWAALAAVPLLLFGGAVTTLRAGMSIEGWLVLEPGHGDHFLLFYPPEKWFRNAGTFVEHTHRLFGTLVGLCAILHVVTTFARVRDARRRRMALLVLAAVCAQGALGGFRVLEASSELAFLHGAFAQAVLALLVAGAIVASRGWSAARATPCAEGPDVRRAAWTAAAVVYAQVVLGAWLRHSGDPLAMALHVLFVVGVLGTVGALARRLGLAAGSAPERAPLRRAGRRLVWILGSQVALGVLATLAVYVFSGGFRGRVSTGELVFATLHVAVGALLLAQCVAAALWSGRLLEAPAPRAALRPAPAADQEASGAPVSGEPAFGRARA